MENSGMFREGRSGPWRIETFTVKENDPGTLYFAFRGRPVHPGTYYRLIHDRRGVVMSNTPAERRDHSEFRTRASGHVLINGLGLGMCLADIVERTEVSKITVVEIDADVIALASAFRGHPKVEIVHSSAFDYRPPAGAHYGAVWHDIWDTICGDNLPQMHKLHRKYGRGADWQGSWSRYIIERELKHNRRSRWAA